MEIILIFTAAWASHILHQHNPNPMQGYGIATLCLLDSVVAQMADVEKD